MGFVWTFFLADIISLFFLSLSLGEGLIRAREIVGFAGSGPIFETENRFISDKKLKNRSIKLCISQDFAIHRLTLSPFRIVHP